MNHDTVLRACERARVLFVFSASSGSEFCRNRQYYKFHDWLVRRDARLTSELAIAKGQAEFWEKQYKEISK